MAFEIVVISIFLVYRIACVVRAVFFVDRTKESDDGIKRGRLGELARAVKAKGPFYAVDFYGMQTAPDTPGSAARFANVLEI